MSADASHGAGGCELRSLLRRWRAVRGKSQLALALDTGVSQRHLSFIESGRSTPSRETLLAVAEALDVPLRDRNALLLAAGYAPMYADVPWDDVTMRSITGAVDRMLRRHEPYPAFLMDRGWNVLATNAAAPHFFGKFIDLHAFHVRTGRRNLLHLLFDPAGMRPFVHDWASVARSLIGRVHRETVGHVLDGRTRALLDALFAYPGVRDAIAGPGTEPDAGLPMVPLGFIHGADVLRYFSLVTTVGTPQTISAQELRVECLFAADEATEARHEAFMAPAR